MLQDELKTKINLIWFGEGRPTNFDDFAFVSTISDPLPSHCDVVLVDQAHAQIPLVTHFVGKVPLVLLVNKTNPAVLRQLISSQNFSAFLEFDSSSLKENIFSVVQNWSQKKNHNQSRKETHQEIIKRNSDLELMNHYLEVAAGERLQILETSLNEERSKIHKERQLIRFLNEASSLKSIDDFMISLRKELRRFHSIQSLFLLIFYDQDAQGFYCETDRVLRFEKNHDFTLEPSSNTPLPEKSIQQLFANFLGRPIRSLGTINAPLRSKGYFYLGFELTGSKDSANEALDILIDRKETMQLMIERFFLEHKQQQFATRWEQTFDSLKTPLAIVSSNMDLFRANKSFINFRDKKKCYQVFGGFESPCDGCPLIKNETNQPLSEGNIRVGQKFLKVNSWPVAESNEISGYVMLYEDVTEARMRFLKNIQNEKISAIGELAGHIAHELNNPLTGIRSLSQVLLSDLKKEDPLSQDIQQIEHAAARSQKLIKLLMDFSSGGSGVIESVSVDDILEKTLPLLKSSMRPHRQEIELSVGASSLVQCDPYLLQQVFFNLINNACQAMIDPGTIVIQTKLSSDQFIEVTIADSGPGLSSEILEHLFEPFYSTKAEGKGTGLGLSTSKTIIEKFGGKITYSSLQPQGAKFTVHLPVSQLSMRIEK